MVVVLHSENSQSHAGGLGFESLSLHHKKHLLRQVLFSFCRRPTGRRLFAPPRKIFRRGEAAAHLPFRPRRAYKKRAESLPLQHFNADFYRPYEIFVQTFIFKNPTSSIDNQQKVRYPFLGTFAPFWVKMSPPGGCAGRNNTKTTEGTRPYAAHRFRYLHPVFLRPGP